MQAEIKGVEKFLPAIKKSKINTIVVWSTWAAEGIAKKHLTSTHMWELLGLIPIATVSILRKWRE